MSEKVVCPNRDKCGEDKTGCDHHEPHDKNQFCEYACYKKGKRYEQSCAKVEGGK